jgi:hypothetical protein
MIKLNKENACVINEVIVAAQLAYWRATGFDVDLKPKFNKFSELLFSNLNAMTGYRHHKVVPLYGKLSNMIDYLNGKIKRKKTFKGELYLACKYAVYSCMLVQFNEPEDYIEEYVLPVLEEWIQNNAENRTEILDNHAMSKILNIMVEYLEDSVVN